MKRDLPLALSLSAALCGLAGGGLANATAVVTLTPTRTTGAPLGGTVTVDAIISGVVTVDDVIVFHDVFLAYDPSVLKLTGFNWGNALTEPPGTTLEQTAGGATNYSTAAAGFVADPAWHLGTVGGLNFSSFGDINTPYYDGSLRLIQSFFSAADFFDLGQNGTSLFTAVFTIVTDQVATSSIVLIDERNFADSTDYDWKAGADSTLAVPPLTRITINNAEVDVPVPVPLVLMAVGLLGMGGVRRLLPTCPSP